MHIFKKHLQPNMLCHSPGRRSLDALVGWFSANCDDVTAGVQTRHPAQTSPAVPARNTKSELTLENFLYT